MTEGWLADRRDLDAAERAYRSGAFDAGWAYLRAVLLRHPWRPKRVRRRPPHAKR